MTIAKTKAEQTLGEQFEAAAARLPGSGWVKELRREAFGRFAAAGLPHRRIEEWKYTDLRERMKEAFAPADGSAKVTAAEVTAALGALAGVAAYRVVFVDGVYRADLSDAAVLAELTELMPFAGMLEKAPDWLKGKFAAGPEIANTAVAALNVAFMRDGIMLKIPAGKALDKPVMLIALRTGQKPAAITTRHTISIQAGARLALIEAHVALPGAAAEAQENVLTDLEIKDGAEVAHVKCYAGSGKAAHLSTWQARLGANCTYRAFQFTADPGLARNTISIVYKGEGAKLDLSGAFLARESQHVDTTLVVDHAVPGCESRELFKGVLDGRARGVFQGKIIVRPDAQKTDGKQMAQALMLSEDAEFDSKPELEIYADDVVCGHGSTCAEIDSDLLFYLRARGIPLAEARAMLIESFIGEAIDKVEHEPLREALMTMARAWLQTG